MADKDNTILTQQFFARPTLVIAKDLIGKVLVRKLPEGTRRYRITEVEAYCGVNDLACHASKGRTIRTEVMFGPAGHMYVYLIYGMYYCLNLVTAEKGEGEAVLIRAVEPLFDTTDFPVGPGRLCKYLQIDKSFNNKKLTKATRLWVEDDGYNIKTSDIKSSPRQGVSYAKNYAKKPWRFYLKGSEFIS